ncbi:MAG: thioredoxin family protein [Verrucomicrobiales bacterium]|nr:thioredoxin family protein [Verrucomicrobiales bacterium]
MKMIGFLVLAPLALLNSGAVEVPERELWGNVLEPARGEVPADPGGKVEWRTDFVAALEEAGETGRPLLVTWRCLPCKQCAEFDKNVLEGSAALDPLLRRFVTVRMTDAAQLDERYFPYKTHQDLDLSWWGYFLGSEGDYYGVFGGKDHVSDSTRISERAFVNSLERVLAHHYDPRREGWGIDLAKGASSAEKRGPEDTRGYSLLKEMRPGLGKAHAEHGACLHCHQVGDMANLEALDAGRFEVKQLYETWPLPENVGILLDRDDGLLVKAVSEGSVAEAAGLKTGDRLGMADGMRLFGQADFRGVLHRSGRGADEIPLAWLRDGGVVFGAFEVEDGWRETENWWRKTVYDGVVGPGMGFFPLNGPRFGKGEGLSVKPWMGRPPSQRPVYQTGLRPNMEIVAIDGMREDLPIRKLITWFRMNHEEGDEVVYTVRGGKEYRFVLPRRE